VAGNPFLPDPSLRISIRAARHFAIRCRRLPPWVGLLSLLEDYAETWDDPQLIPKRRWSRIYERDGYRCMAPGCTARRQIQDHHVQYRLHRGSDDLWNQLSLCRFHHLQGEHGRFAQVRGRAPLDIIWRLGRPDLATWWKNERRLDGPPEDWRWLVGRIRKAPLTTQRSGTESNHGSNIEQPFDSGPAPAAHQRHNGSRVARRYDSRRLNLERRSALSRPRLRADRHAWIAAVADLSPANLYHYFEGSRLLYFCRRRRSSI
jgi:hypothetical protein